MQNCIIRAINSDVHIDGNSMTLEEAEQLALRIREAARVARLQRARLHEMAAKVGLVRPRDFYA